MSEDSRTTEHDLEEIHEEVTEITVTEIKEPTEAPNERGNPEVSVVVQQFGRTIERYTFEFIRPSDEADHPRYRPGPYRVSEDAKQSRYQNKAKYEAAKALAEHTAMTVTMTVDPVSKLEDLEQRSSSET